MSVWAPGGKRRGCGEIGLPQRAAAVQNNKWQESSTRIFFFSEEKLGTKQKTDALPHRKTVKKSNTAVCFVIGHRSEDKWGQFRDGPGSRNRGRKYTTGVHEAPVFNTAAPIYNGKNCYLCTNPPAFGSGAFVGGVLVSIIIPFR